MAKENALKLTVKLMGRKGGRLEQLLNSFCINLQDTL